VANVIREAKTFMLPGIIQTGKKLGMQLMDDSLSSLYHAGVITADEAVSRSEDKQVMKQICGML
jgi:twitching motility protein PilT